MTAPRNIVVCLDGTNNSPAAARTNVQRLYRMIEKGPQQVAYYQPGVGTLEPIGAMGSLRRRALMLQDSASGWMLQRHVCAAYEFLSDVYRDGDRVYIFGFSRGAYSARVLAAMLNTVGLLHAGMHEMVAFAWRTYTRLPPFGAWRSSPARRQRAMSDYFRRMHGFRKSYSRPVPVHFLGLWDTVSSVGPPWLPRVYSHTANNRGVATVRHAVALDERRGKFVQNLWSTTPHRHQDVRELWFAGSHGDVGGGYANGRHGELARIPLAWMLREAEAAGLRIEPVARKDAALPDLNDVAQWRKHAQAPTHDELSHWYWRLLEWLPIPFSSQDAKGEWTRRWRPHRSRPRTLRAGALVHESVYERMRLDGAYRPVNLRDDATPAS